MNEQIRHLKDVKQKLGVLNCNIIALSNASSSGGACPPVPPTVNCTTVKCCDPTDECKSVFVTTCYTTPITVITVPGEPGSGDASPNACATGCGGLLSPADAATSVPYTCDYTVGETTETTKISYADGTPYTGDPTVLDPTCNCQDQCEIITKNVCFEDCTEGCILIKVNVTQNTTEVINKLDSEGQPTDKIVAPCPKVEILTNEMCEIGDQNIIDEINCSQFDTNYAIIDNATDIGFSSNSTDLKWEPSTGNNTAGATAFTQAVMDCIDAGGSATIIKTDQNDTPFEFIATSYTGTASSTVLFSGTGVTAGSGKLKTATLTCSC